MGNDTEIKIRKRREKMVGLIVGLGIIAVLVIGGIIAYSKLEKEHNEARNIPLNEVDFSRLKDGTYIGEYEGGMYKWRENQVRVTVSSGKVTKIELLESKLKVTPELNKLYDRVIQNQSLQVDAITGATLDSKAFLKAVENALKNAQTP